MYSITRYTIQINIVLSIYWYILLPGIESTLIVLPIYPSILLPGFQLSRLAAPTPAARGKTLASGHIRQRYR